MNTFTPSTITEHELSEIRGTIQRRSGIVFDESRARFLGARLHDHMEAKSLPRGTDLIRLIGGSNAEYDQLLERLLTQETSFFRYPAIYRALAQRVVPELQARKFWQSPRSLRFWSAGCSTGEEPYSIAITLLDALENPDTWDIQVLATDISRHALQLASDGSYERRELLNLSPEQIANYFTHTSDQYIVRRKLHDLVAFAPMNLAQMVYMGRFDCIFCMNVLIYFSEELRTALIRRFSDYLEPGGYLFLGHAESLAKAGVGLEPIVVGDSLIYRKADRNAGGVA